MSTFHHVGIATTDIQQLAAEYERVLGLTLTTAIVADEDQRVSVAFAALDGGGFIELVEPFGADSPIARIVERGGGPYHVCFRVPDLAAALSAAREAGAIIVSSPRPASALGGKQVAFVYLSGNNLIEFLEE